MEIKKIKTGEITEQELVNLFGNKAQKKSYKKNGRFVSNYKQSLLKNVSKYCKIKDYGKRIYRISEVYEYDLPFNFHKMNKSLYKYIVPLLLPYLINGHDENNKIDMNLNRWARKINMINKNYNLVKYNQKNISNVIHYPFELMNEFVHKLDNMIEWYINNAFDYLQSSGLVVCNEVYHVCKEVSDGKAKIDELGNVCTGIRPDKHLASEEELKFYFHCVDIADAEAGIENNKERYYSKKAKLFNYVLKKELYKEKIKYVHKTYEIYCTNLEKCKFVLSRFGENDIDMLTDRLNDEFTTMIIENAEKRFDSNPDKYKYCDDKNDYRQCFEGLCEIVINKDTEYIGTRIKKKKFEDDYSLHII